MNKSIMLIALGILIVIFLALVIVIVSDDELITAEEQRKELKQTFDECIDRGDKDWCCKEEWEGNKLIEKECRAFDYDYVEDFGYDREAEVFGSGSMLPLLNQGDNLYYREISEDEILWLGKIYSYESGDKYIVHRLVGKSDEDYYIFKGDSKLYTDKPVHRGEVTHELIAICFGGYCDE